MMVCPAPFFQQNAGDSLISEVCFDVYLRTYFWTNTIQIEIDASLFSKALEAIDPVLTKKLYVQLSIAQAASPSHGCGEYFFHQRWCCAVSRLSCRSGSPRCSSEAFPSTTCTECGIYLCMMVSCPCSSESSSRTDGSTS